MNADDQAPEPLSNDQKNRRLALWIFAGMLCSAGVATVSMLSMTSFRREVDRVQPPQPAFWRTVLTDVAIFGVIVGLVGLVWAFLHRSRSDHSSQDAADR
jgi:hypothetical protein